MTLAIEQLAFSVFLLFCRIGGCMMFAPGLSSRRIPMPFRLLLAVALAAGLGALVADEMNASVAVLTAEERLAAIAGELASGAFIGLLARLFVLAVEFAATAAATAIGLFGIPGIPLDDTETGSPLATFAGLSAVALIVLTDLHAELIGAVIDSYRVLPLGAVIAGIDFEPDLLRTLSETTNLALRLAAPFLAYGIVVNSALGLANKFAPQVTVYHATSGLVMLGGLLLFWLVAPDWFGMFLENYAGWLSAGGF